ncbi:MAG TPA: DUF881 domain-containing protein [Acidimicrobiales bacterium]|nr:DUF881 domain-containing protein [Acidimicrobiales bacterium]
MPRRSSLVLAAVFTVLGFLLVTAAGSARAGRKQAEPRKAQLVKLIQQRRSQVGDLDQAVRQLRTEVADAQRRASRQGRQDREQAKRSADLAEAAGTVALRGKAVVVKLSDSDKTPADPDQADAYRIRDSDLQLVVNALFSAGAEAIDVNGSRLVATTPIRSAGDTIVVNFRPLGPPYEVSAIGADRAAFERSEIAKRFSRWEHLFGLGFSVREATVTVPAYTGRVGISTAKPTGGN